jgi:hypothetical protein
MDVHCRYAALRTAEDEGWLYPQKKHWQGLKMMQLHHC